MRILTFCFFLCLALLSCKNEPKATDAAPAPTPPPPTEIDMDDPNVQQRIKDLKPSANNKGLIEIKGVNMSHPISLAMVSKGKSVFDSKCANCHSLDGEANSASDLAQGLTKRKPEWIMNMIYNPSVEVWANAQEEASLKQCLTRQPGQALSIENARDFVELLRTFQEE